jgi:hypothetical protein
VTASQKELPPMSATVHAFERPASARASALRAPRASIARALPPEHAWLVDVGALAECRSLFSGHESQPTAPRISLQSLLDVPPAYEQFCRSHFATVKRLHPELQWSDACFAYAVALSAHAVLCTAIDEEHERRLAQAWPRLRGESRLEWQQASRLVADGCSALARLDPLAMCR